MSEIEVGEYVRTSKGKIDTAIKQADDKEIRELILKCKKSDYWREEIVKHSHNIIDLIEVGDYVNGRMVYEILKDKRIHIITGHLLNNDDIKTILTKEQFAQNAYEVEEPRMELEEAIKVLEDENQVIYNFTTGKFNEKWKTAYKTLIQVAKNSIPKQEIENILNKLNITDPEPWSTYKVGGNIIFDLKELLEGK